MALIRYFMLFSFYFSFIHAQGQVDEDTHNLSMDQLIENAAVSSRSMDFAQPDDTVLVELDMKYKKEDWEQIKRFRLDPNLAQDDVSRAGRYKRKAIRDKRWRNNEIPYVISNIFTANNRATVMAAFNEYHQHTCLRFRPARSSDRHKIAIQNGGGCSSFVGQVGGTQGVFLAPACRVKGVIIHELGHAIGFQHEQTRPDRDQYVTIKEENIPRKYRSNFQRYSRQVVNSLDVEYDYRSVMHYGRMAFSNNGKETIVTTDRRYQNIIGQRMGLSFRDIKLLNLMYSCHSKCPRKLKCPGEGFQGKNCKCWCPGNPVKPCEDPRKISGGPVASPECKDKHGSCTWYKSQNYCNGRYAGSMKIYCAKTCGYCQIKVNKTCRLPHIENSRIRKVFRVIRDLWAEFQPGEEIDIGCSHGFTRWGVRYTRCRPDGTWDMPTKPVCNPVIPLRQCPLVLIDYGRYTDVVAENDASYGNYDYGDYAEGTPSALAADQVQDVPIGARLKVVCDKGYRISGYEIVECKEDGTITTPPRCVPDTDCEDRNSNCPRWAQYNQCRVNPGYMLQYCKKSCNSCS